MFRKLIVDSRAENKGLVKTFTKKYRIKRVVILAYNSKANSMIERGYRPIKAALVKLTNRGKGSWLESLYMVLLADRCTTKATTGLTSFYMMYSQEAVLPIELSIPT